MRDGWHPHRDQLAEFELGKLGSNESRILEAHLATCVECQERIVETAANDAFIQRLQQIHQEKRQSPGPVSG